MNYIHNIMVKIFKNKDNEKVLKAAREKWHSLALNSRKINKYYLRNNRYPKTVDSI